MPVIEAITAEPYDVELAAPLTWGKHHALPQLNHVLVTVHLSDGATGTGECTPRPTIYGETQTGALTIIRDYLAPRITGETLQSAADIHRLDAQLAQIKNNQTARGALNIALHAALARSGGVSLADWLGVTQPAVRVSTIVGTGTPDDVLADMTATYQAGVRVFKVKVGRDFAEETSIIRDALATLPDAEIYVDANQCYTDVQQAADHLRRLAEMGVRWCEEPLPVHRLKERAALRKQHVMPLIGDDSCFSLTDVQREIEAQTVDIVNIKTARTGYSQSSAIYDAARTGGLRVMVGSQASSLPGCMHAVLFAARAPDTLPTEATFYLKTSPDNAPPITDGSIRVADALHALDAFET